VLSAQLG